LKVSNDRKVLPLGTQKKLIMFLNVTICVPSAIFTLQFDVDRYQN